MVERRDMPATDALIGALEELETPEIRVAGVVVPRALMLVNAERLR